MPSLTLKPYVYGFVVALFFGLVCACGVLYIENHLLQKQLADFEAQKAKAAGAAAQAEKEMNTTETRIQQKIVYRTKQSEPIYRYIETFKGDANATFCENNMSLLRSFTF